MTLDLQGPGSGLEVKLAVLGYMCPGEKRILFTNTQKESGFQRTDLQRKILGRRTQQWLIQKCVKTIYSNKPLPAGQGVNLPGSPLLYLHFRFYRHIQKHQFCRSSEETFQQSSGPFLSSSIRPLYKSAKSFLPR